MNQEEEKGEGKAIGYLENGVIIAQQPQAAPICALASYNMAKGDFPFTLALTYYPHAD
jgi:hypothetical protein